MIILEKVATSHNCNFMMDWCFLCLCKNNFQKTLTKAACKVIVVLHIYHNFLVSDKQDHLQTKSKFWPLSKFE